MKIFDRILYDILYKILWGFLLILLFPLLSRVTKWDYPRFIERIPVGYLILSYIIIFFLAVLTFFLKRKSSVDKSNLDRKVSDFRMPSVFGEEDIGVFKYNKVGWTLSIPKALSLNPFYSPSKKERLLKLVPEEIGLDYFPFCPECVAQLEESDTFFGRYLWKCKKCEFKKKNRNSFHDEKKKATLKAREEFKKFIKGMETENFALFEKYFSEE
ncbi:hypothetical protein HQ584_12740 [Patescibacteria group bacterium]|nr:hypothetical protein [Patescibacteria group bacterium]